MDTIFVSLLALWACLSVLRLIRMYDRGSRFQRWRRWDCFHLIPVGAFFGPNPPHSEYWILVRDFLEDGRITPWTEAPRLPARRWTGAIWWPGKHIGRAKADAARGIFDAVANTAPGDKLPVSFVVSEAYLTTLQFVSALPRINCPRAVQFAVMETDLLSRSVIRSVVSSVHEL